MNIQQSLQDLLDLLLFENYEIEVTQDEHNLSFRVVLSEEDSGILIGRRGETLAALQRILRTIYSDDPAVKRILINVNDYRDQREERIHALVDRGIDRIQGTGEKYRLYRLTSAERFFAHNLIATDENYQDYTSYSINDDDGDRVLIIEEKA